jgi:hypothetical protein
MFKVLSDSNLNKYLCFERKVRGKADYNSDNLVESLIKVVIEKLQKMVSLILINWKSYNSIIRDTRLIDFNNTELCIKNKINFGFNLSLIYFNNNG